MVSLTRSSLAQEIMIKFYCTYCGQRIEASEEIASTACVCPSCGKEINVPHIQSDRSQDRVPDSPEPTSDAKAPETDQDPSLPATYAEKTRTLGGKLLSFTGSGILILVVVLYGRQCGGFIGRQAAEKELSEKAATQVEHHSTQRILVDFDLVGMMIRLPGKPNERVVSIPDAVKATLKSKDSYLYQNGKQTISIARDVFIEEFDFSSRCDIVFGQLKSVDPDASQRDYLVDGLSGRRFEFNAGNGMYCDLLIFSRETTVWQVQVLNIASRSKSTKALSNDIFSSIRIGS